MSKKCRRCSVCVVLLSVLPVAATFGQTQLITNGGFESGTFTGWTKSGPIVGSTSGQAHGGSRYAVLGEIANSVDTLYQSFTIPANASYVELSYWWNVTTSESPDSEYDWMDVTIRNTSNQVLRYIGSVSNLHGDCCTVTYQRSAWDITEWAGQTIRVYFEAHMDSGIVTYFRVDDVSVLATVASTGSLRMTISPQAAIDAGAQWNVDGGSWKNSGATVSELSVGSHDVSFRSASGWTKPGDMSVTISANQTTFESGTYTQQSGSLNVTISPQAAIDAGGQWNVDGGSWKNSGATVSGLSVGSHNVSFRSASGWTKPGDMSVTISANQTTFESGTYTQQSGSLNVTISPQAAIDAGAQWNVDGGSWKNSGATVSGLSVGSHNVSFRSASGWTKPGDMSVTISANQPTFENGTYTQQPQQSGFLNVTISPQAAIDAGAQWNVDGGAWQNSGTTVSGLSVGSHNVSFRSASGWTKPGDQSVTIGADQLASTSGVYTQNSGTITDQSKQQIMLGMVNNHRGPLPAEAVLAVIFQEAGQGAFHANGASYNWWYEETAGPWAQPDNKPDGIMQVEAGNPYHERSGPYTNTQAGYDNAINDGCRYLKDQFSRYGTEWEAILHYNTGGGTLYVYKNGMGDPEYLSHVAYNLKALVPPMFSMTNATLVQQLTTAQGIVDSYVNDSSILADQAVSYYTPYQQQLDAALHTLSTSSTTSNGVEDQPQANPSGQTIPDDGELQNDGTGAPLPLCGAGVIQSLAFTAVFLAVPLLSSKQRK